MRRNTVIAMLLTLLLTLSASAMAEGGLGGVADASDMTDVVDVVEEGMVPVTVESLNEGTYEVVLVSSSSMFKVVRCELTVADGAMSARLVMKSDAYPYMYAGSAEEASGAAEEALIPLAQDGEEFSFTLPVPALDAGIECAAFSQRKQVWYPRTLLVRSDSLPETAWSAEALVTAESLGLADGVYTVEAALDGGHTSVESPVTLTVADGACTADIVFSTAKIDYVIVNGEQLLPTNAGGNAAFTIPVGGFDRNLPITVDSTAIKPATEVQYSIRFDSASIAPAE